MNQPFYSIGASADKLRFEFESIGPQQNILKAVTFTLLNPGARIYNLAFGDVGEDGFLDDEAVSNNGDMEVVLATVVQTLLAFLEAYPDRKVFFTGSTPARTRLYRIIIDKYIESVADELCVEGVLNGKTQAFVRDVRYTAFLISIPKLVSEL